MTSWNAYPKIYNLGHAEVENLLRDYSVVVEEKVDGSQFSFGVINGELKARSKNVEFDPYVILPSQGMFKPACETVIALYEDNLLEEGWTYRGEVLTKPKHHTLAYDRVPTGNIAIFDIAIGEERYVWSSPKAAEAEILGLEVVPLLGEFAPGELTRDRLDAMLDRESFLGGAKIEGVVVKAYGIFDSRGKTLMGKYVSEAFKEIQPGEWRKDNPTKTDVIDRIVERYRTEARWEKALHALRDHGLLEDSPRDIGKLIPYVIHDVESECKDMIAGELYSFNKRRIMGGVTQGLPEWYKQRLLDKQFAPEVELGVAG